MDKKIQILLAEDDSQLGTLIMENLEDEGYDRFLAETPVG